jgi:hypothetical protein
MTSSAAAGRIVHSTDHANSFFGSSAGFDNTQGSSNRIIQVTQPHSKEPRSLSNRVVQATPDFWFVISNPTAVTASLAGH